MVIIRQLEAIIIINPGIRNPLHSWLATVRSVRKECGSRVGIIGIYGNSWKLKAPLEDYVNNTVDCYNLVVKP